MPGISQCPECDQKITLPRSTHPETQVQSPLCDAKDALRAALDLAPPALIVLEEADPVGVANLERESSFDSAWGSGDAATQEIVRPTSDSDDGLEGYELEGSATGDGVGDDEQFSADNFADDDFASGGFGSDVATSTADPDDFSDAGLEADTDAEFEPFGDVPVAMGESSDDGPMFEASGNVPTMAPLSKRKKSKGSSFIIRQIVGVFGGGAIGLSVGYMIILWIKGPTGDFLKVGSKLPSFMVPAAFSTSVEPTSSDTPKTVEQEIANRPEFAAFKPKQPEPGATASNEENGGNGFEFGEEPAGNSLADGVKEAEANSENGQLDVEDIAPLIGPTNLKGHTGAELSIALKSASNMKDKLKVSGEWGKEQGGAYMKFCQLAEALISIKNPNEPGLQLQSRRNAARNILNEFAAEDHVVEKLSATSKMWYERMPRKSQGVLLAGRIESIAEEGAFYGVEVLVDGQPITVITKDKPTWSEGQSLVVLGTIVDEPQFNLGGYTGEAQTVVWSQLSLGTTK